MDNLDRIDEIMQCVGRLWSVCDVDCENIADDLHTISDNIMMIKAELLELWGQSESVRHGRWVLDRGLVVCSECRYPLQQIGAKDFCGKCGAKMDKERV